MSVSASLRPLQQTDVPEMNRIFNYYVEHSFAAYTQEKAPLEFTKGFLEQGQSLGALGVVDLSDRLLGFGVLRPYSPWKTFEGTALVTYFLDPDSVGQGLGTRLLEALEQKARAAGIRTLLAHVSSKNDASLSFHTGKGFQQCGCFHAIGEKHGEVFDVVWFEKTISRT